MAYQHLQQHQQLPEQPPTGGTEQGSDTEEEPTTTITEEG